MTPDLSFRDFCTAVGLAWTLLCVAVGTAAAILLAVAAAHDLADARHRPAFTVTPDSSTVTRNGITTKYLPSPSHTGVTRK